MKKDKKPAWPKSIKPLAAVGATASAKLRERISTPEFKKAVADLVPELQIRAVKMSATWCGYCRPMKPLWAKFVAAHPGLDHEELDLDTDRGEEVAKRYDINSVPYVLFIEKKTGKALATHDVACNLAKLEELFAKAVAKLK